MATLSFPSMCRFSERERDGMPPVQRYAAMVGCPEKYLYLAAPEYATLESYNIHPYRNVQVQYGSTPKEIIAADQLSAAGKIVDMLFGDCSGTLTVINGHPSLQETYLLLWHVVCHFSAVKFSNPIKWREHAFSFIGNFKLEDSDYHCHRSHTLAFGPALDEMNNYHVSTYVDTLMRFDDLNKILITSTTNINQLLERLRIVPKNVHSFINLSERIEAIQEEVVPVVKRGRKPSRKESFKKFSV